MDIVSRIYANRAEELAELNQQLIIDEGHSNPMSIAELAARMRGWLDTGYECYGIERDGKIVCYSLWRDDIEHYYMRQLFTVAACRRQGLARHLLSSLQTDVYDDKPVRLEVLAGNLDAQAFYKSMGYQLYCHTLIKT